MVEKNMPNRTFPKKSSKFIKLSALQKLFDNHSMAGFPLNFLEHRESSIKSFKLENGLDSPISVRA